MVTRRFAQVSTSDEEDEAPQTRLNGRNSSPDETEKRQRKRKKVMMSEDEEEEDGEDRGSERRRRGRGRGRGREEEDEVEEEVEDEVEAKPIGEAVRVSGKGRGRRSHYEGFEYDGNQYELEDPVLLVPEGGEQKPYVAIIKDVTQSKDGNMMVLGQWFYRPEEAEKKGGGNWQSQDTRELFYSFHRDEVPAESVMHKCVVHFVPAHKQLPKRKQHPGFIVRKVYDTVAKKLWKLTDKDYEDNKQHEIDLLVQKTMSRLGDLPDIELEENVNEQEDQTKSKRFLRKKSIAPVDVRKEEEANPKPHQNLKAETPGSCPNVSLEHRSILEKFNVLTGDAHRDRCLEKLLQAVQYMCSTSEEKQAKDEGKISIGGSNQEQEEKISERENGLEEKDSKAKSSFLWPDVAVTKVSVLEQASHDLLASDFQKYNQKLRQLVFNLKNNSLLVQRLLNGELDPEKILNMSPNELKVGLTIEETAKEEPDESKRMRMTDARCTRCNEFKVGLQDIIQAGHGDRYQLECIACGNSWYASRDEASALTIDTPNSAKNVGVEPLATAKFEDVEKKLANPHEPDKSADTALNKASEAAEVPTLDTQKSFSKLKKEEQPEAAARTEQSKTVGEQEGM